MPLASIVLNEARFLLNDVGAKLATDTVLLPALKKAYRELQQNLVDNGISVARDQSAALAVPAATTALTFGSTPALPANLIYPIMLHEKQTGQSDSNYQKMTESVWPPDVTASTYRNNWAWIEDEVRFPAAVGANVIRIRFWGSLAPIVDGTTNIPILDCETFLSARTAALAAIVIRKDENLAIALSGDGNNALGILLSTAVKNRQANPTRRRRFRSFLNRGWR